MLFLKPLYLLIALILLQLFPYTGVFLMLVAGGLITGLVVHVVLALMAVDALTRRGPVWLLLFPALFYGGYYLRYFQQKLEIARTTAELAATNPKKILAYDPDAHSLVMAGASGFVTTHDLPVAYQENRNFQPEGYLSYRLTPRAQCDAIVEDTQSRIEKRGVHADGVFQKGVCRLRFPEVPPHPVVSVVVTPDPKNDRMKRGVNIQTTSIVVDGRTLGAFRTAKIPRLPTFPWLYIGCALNSAAPAWVCDAAVMRATFAIDATPADVDPAIYDSPLAIMLGIRKYRPGALNNFVGFPQNAHVPEAVARERARVEDETFAVLERVLAGGRIEGIHNLGYALARNPGRLEPYAERMARRLVELEDADPPPPSGEKRSHRRLRRDEPRALATAIAALSPAAFAPLAGPMFDLARREDFSTQYPALYLRAADVGPRALDFYKAAFLAQPVAAGESEAILPALALCRIGVADPAVIKEMKTRYLPAEGEKSRRDPARSALFVALLKFGEADFLRANEALAAPRDRSWRETLLSGKGWNAVGPNNCMTQAWSGGHRPEVLAPILQLARNGWEEKPN